MAHEPIYHETKKCPYCYSTVRLFGKSDLDQWRCVDPTCKGSKEQNGYLVGEKLIEKERIKIKVIPN